METKQRIERNTRELPSTSPAVHFLRPVLLVLAGLVAAGLFTRHAGPMIAAIVIAVLAVVPAIVLHGSYRRRREQREGIRCG
jgi:Flp pilus assembly protein TadB